MVKSNQLEASAKFRKLGGLYFGKLKNYSTNIIQKDSILKEPHQMIN